MQYLSTDRPPRRTRILENSEADLGMAGEFKAKPSLEASLIALNAALYASFGYLTYLGIFAPVFGTVRFWPAVIIPAAFSILCSPKIGGIGAAIGIFISDMLVHGSPLLSLTVGVPANLIAFYLIGLLARRWRGGASAALSVGVQLIPLLGCVALYSWSLPDELTATVFLAVSIAVLVFTLMLSAIRRRFLGVVAASSIGLMIGSVIIGAGLWAYSQFFILPVGNVRNAPLVAAVVWFLWTYLTEIPFLHFLLPPILQAVSKAVPSKVGYVSELVIDEG